MSDKEKMKEFENWLKEQKKIAGEKCVKAVNNGHSRSTFIHVITEAVLLQVLNKFVEIEREARKQ